MAHLFKVQFKSFFLIYDHVDLYQQTLMYKNNDQAYIPPFMNCTAIVVANY